MYKLFSQLFIIAFFLFPGLSFGEGKKFTINGKIPEMPSGRMIVITQLVDRWIRWDDGIFMAGSSWWKEK